jgi:glycosyltransferase involved in cell wall biosynthesis
LHQDVVLPEGWDRMALEQLALAEQRFGPIGVAGVYGVGPVIERPNSRAVLMPSLWRESLGRVPIESMANGIPVLASDRGALPETLGDARFVFTIPERCTSTSAAIPTTHEVAPWVATIERLREGPDFEARHHALAKAEATRWESSRLGAQYDELFTACRDRR